MGWRARSLLAGLSLWALAAGARAGDQLQYGPAGDWVRPITPAAPAHAVSKAAHAILNRSIQTRYSDDGTQVYTETMVRIQTPRGLGAARPTVEWDPGDETVTINKAQLIRDGHVIDLLGRGQGFTIVRREPDLEHAMLDGQLTAILQPDGVEVGDIIDFAYTTTEHVDVMGPMSEDLWSGMGSNTVGKRYYRFLWPAAKPLRWRLSDDLPVPDIVTADGWTEMTLNVDTYVRPPVPDQAPDRFNRLGEIQFTQFTSWPQVSAWMAPYYDKAAALDAASPLKAEAAKIRALSDDPRVQASAALHLVQQKVRYLYVHGSGGGFMPPRADLTWLRRWGDCKAKTALLVALLRELGIAADPALVDIDDGDGKNERLPALALFDHIIVRATIAGKVYWLDGTMDIDGDLDETEIPDGHWALPVTAAGADLTPLVVPPMARPFAEHHVALDASAGLDAPARAHVEVVVRGQRALDADADWRELLPEQMDAKMRAYWSKIYPWIAIDSHDESFDPATHEMHYVMDGVAQMRWTKPRAGHPRFLETDGYDIADAPKPPMRLKGLHDDAPVVVAAYPAYVRTTETIRLPDDGKGFAIIGRPVDETLAGVAMKRTLAIRDGVFTMEATRQAVAPEVPLAEVLAAADELKTLNDEGVFLEAPVADGGPAAVAEGAPASGADGPQSTVSGSDALWTDPGAAPVAAKRATLPDSGVVPGDSLDGLVRLYGGDRRGSKRYR